MLKRSKKESKRYVVRVTVEQTQEYRIDATTPEEAVQKARTIWATSWASTPCFNWEGAQAEEEEKS